MVRNNKPGSTVALRWLGLVAAELILALYTFKAGLTSTGMDASRAYTRAVAWEAVHLLLVVVVLPAAFFATLWRYLRTAPVRAWTGSKIVVAWLGVLTVWLFGMMAESTLSETVLSVYEPPVVAALYFICGLITVVIIATTVLWLMHRSPPE
jgi:hypothetical protein